MVVPDQAWVAGDEEDDFDGFAGFGSACFRRWMKRVRDVEEEIGGFDEHCSLNVR